MEAVVDTLGDAHALIDILADMLAVVETVTLGDSWGDAHALFYTLAETLAEMEAKTLGDTRGDLLALVDTLTDTVAEVEDVGDTRSKAHALVGFG